jgi:hypothetical protein
MTQHLAQAPETQAQTRTTSTPWDLSNVGGGTALAVTYLGLIPGVLPTLALTALAIALVVLPVLALGLAAGVVIAPPYGIWRLATRGRRRTRRSATVKTPRSRKAGLDGFPQR